MLCLLQWMIRSPWRWRRPAGRGWFVENGWSFGKCLRRLWRRSERGTVAWSWICCQTLLYSRCALCHCSCRCVKTSSCPPVSLRTALISSPSPPPVHSSLHPLRWAHASLNITISGDFRCKHECKCVFHRLSVLWPCLQTVRLGSGPVWLTTGLTLRRLWIWADTCATTSQQ